ncbi:lytic transglycosylase [Desulfonema ishimotonii]|uniref:Lytic transglycosylase n=1 Tax=Desulfonema ishimotonii TaxID=45657 RepID=A0A401FUW3_9BACT|nr:lytic transglycosylase domain-containing protein [Desulfonema ishimotonii]GBC60761.1 lytic transglycosylase [Desulfonema ishimotonii]
MKSFIRNFSIVLGIFIFGLTAAWGGSSQGREPLAFPSLVSGARIDPPLDFCGEAVPLADELVRERLEKEMLLSMWNRPQVILWIKRSGRYMPYIEKMLKKHNMPEDLKYVAIVESALLPHIGSSKGAIGYWQFIRPTGRKYGLRIDNNMDERRNIFASTQAAIRYFKKLHGDFGSWTLAAAAYNMGEQGLQRRITEQKAREYYNLYLPLETQRYIFKILATKLILSDMKKFGFNLEPGDLYSPLKFDRVEVSLSQNTPVQLLAEAANTYYKTIKEMNPEIRGNSVVKGNHALLIPRGASRKFHARLKKQVEKYRAAHAAKKKIVYVVRKGDYLSAIANKFNVPLSDLLRWNKLRSKSPIHPGHRLVIFR